MKLVICLYHYKQKLLRAIETKRIQRVGGKGEIELDLRLICATHQNIEKKIDEGLFRADLFYRINVFPIEIPTLAERKDDIPILVSHILNEIKQMDQSLQLLKNLLYCFKRICMAW